MFYFIELYLFLLFMYIFELLTFTRQFYLDLITVIAVTIMWIKPKVINFDREILLLRILDYS